MSAPYWQTYDPGLTYLDKLSAAFAEQLARELDEQIIRPEVLRRTCMGETTYAHPDARIQTAAAEDYYASRRRWWWRWTR